MTATAPTPTSISAAARAVDVTKVYGAGDTAVHALAGVSIEFRRGQYAAIMGPSGSGKSTLLHCLAGLDRVTTGRIFLGDDEISAMGEKQLTMIRREKIGFVFQAYNLVPTLTGLENISLPLALAGKKPDAEWLAQIIDTVHLADRVDHRPNELSGGQQQRVAVARALVSRPEVIFADEPTGNLDSDNGRAILQLLETSHRAEGATLVMVTHDREIASAAGRILTLEDGRLSSPKTHAA